MTKEKIEELRALLQMAVASRFAEEKYHEAVDELCDLALKGLSSTDAAGGPLIQGSTTKEK